MKAVYCLLLFLLGCSVNGQSLVLDPTFGSNGVVINGGGLRPKNGYFENNQYYLFGTGTRFTRYNYDGSVDWSFGNSSFFVFSIPGEYPELVNFKMHNGKCYGFGKTNSTSTLVDGIVIRLTTNGLLDPTFGTNGVARVNLGTDEYFNDILINDDGSFYAIGVKQTANYDARVLLCRFLENGTLDTSFNTSGYKVFPYTKRAKGISIFRYEDNILLGNWTIGTNGNSVIYLQKIDSDGNLMPDFGTNGELEIPIPVFGSSNADNFYNLKVVGNRVYAHFYYGLSFNSQGFSLYVYDIDNPAEPLWHIGLYKDSYFTVLDSGKILYARGIDCPHTSCYSTSYVIQLYNPDGSLDTTFDNDGTYQYNFTTLPQTTEGATFAYQHNDGRIFIAGSYNNLCMLRIGSAELGTPDPNSETAFSVYPNPSSHKLYINNKSNSIPDNLFITDISGKKIEAQLNSDNSIDVASLSNGIYFLSFTSENKPYTLKFVKS